MVYAIVLGRNTTATTYNIARTHCTFTFYVEESDGCENGDTVAISPFFPVGDTVENAVSMLATEISELDTIGFDETVLLDETVDYPYEIDA
jgi:hypothetical protein